MSDSPASPDRGSPFQVEVHTLSDGSSFSVPANAIPQIKALLLNVKEHQILPDDQQTEEWLQWGHRLGNAMSALTLTGVMDSADKQQKKLVEVTRSIINTKGEGIQPYLIEFGFPDTR